MAFVDKMRAMLSKARSKPDTGHQDVCSCEDCMKHIDGLNYFLWDKLPAMLEVIEAADFASREMMGDHYTFTDRKALRMIRAALQNIEAA